MELRVVTISLLRHCHLLASIVVLLARRWVQNNAESGSHPHDLTISRVSAVLVAILSPVSMNELDLKLCLRLLLVDSDCKKIKNLQPTYRSLG